jgi:hypothetical protein
VQWILYSKVKQLAPLPVPATHSIPVVSTGLAPGAVGGVARLSRAGGPSYGRRWRQSAGGCSVMAMVPVKISSLTMKAIAVT